MTSTVPTSAPAARRPGGSDTRAALRHGAGRRGPEPLDPLAVVIDPQVPGAVRDALLPPLSDLTGYHVMYAGRIYHRRYVRPRVHFDPSALTAWHRAVGAANLIYRAECIRDRVVDTERAEAEVPELLWKIAEGLAKLSDVRIYLKEIVPGAEQFHPVVEAKIKAYERYLARCSGQVSQRIDRLLTVAGKLAAANAARRDEELLERLVEVEPRILHLVASTDESIAEIDMAEGLKLDAVALTEVTNQAINDLSVRDEEGRPSASPSPSRL
jgi:hypothetical protein